MRDTHLFTCESVAPGHPDKVADRISDAVVDWILARDPGGRVACETLIGPRLVVVAGEVTARGVDHRDLERAVIGLVRRTVRRCGFGVTRSGFDLGRAEILVRIGAQSQEIGRMVEQGGPVGAGDQGLMFGYATDETPERLPAGLSLSRALLRRLDEVRRMDTVPGLGADAKAQVTVRHEGRLPVGLDTVILSTQHDRGRDLAELRRDLLQRVVGPCLTAAGWSMEGVALRINHAGSFVQGGPAADTGLTGRKIVADTYGGACPHGGGAFSGKDPTKVDRSAAYAARWMALHAVEAGLARRITIQLAYAIGSTRPVSLWVDTHGTGALDDGELARALDRVFDLSPAAILDSLDLRRPIYEAACNLGHFGGPAGGFAWEQTPRVKALLEEVRTQRPDAMGAVR